MSTDQQALENTTGFGFLRLREIVMNPGLWRVGMGVGRATKWSACRFLSSLLVFGMVSMVTATLPAAQSSPKEVIRQTTLQFLAAYTKGDLATAERFTTGEYSPEFLFTANTLRDFPVTYSVESVHVIGSPPGAIAVARVRIPLRALATEIQGTASDAEIALLIIENRKPFQDRNLPPDLFGRSGRLAAVLDGINYWLAVNTHPAPIGSYAVWVRHVPIVNRGGRWLIRKSIY